MKSLSANLQAHLAGEYLTIATLWKVTRLDQQVFGFTDHDQDVIYGGVTYRAATGAGSSAIETPADMSIPNCELAGFLDSSAITEVDLTSGVWDYALVEQIQVNYNALSDGHVWIRKGRLGEVRMAGKRFEAELRGLALHLQQTIVEVTTPTCRAELFDARCKLVAASYQVSGTVTASGGNASFTDSGRSEASDYFGAGIVTWTGGANNGRRMEIKSFASGVFTLALPMAYAIAVGDTYTALPGCRKTVGNCQSKFAVNNIVNFRGEPHIPGIRKWISGRS